jgi:hypothetical protein
MPLCKDNQTCEGTMERAHVGTRQMQISHVVSARFDDPMNRPGFDAHLLAWEGWHHAAQVRPGDEVEGDSSGH